MKGGKIIGTGSFGCVFDPPLSCRKKFLFQRDNNNNKTRKISKLMTIAAAEDEKKEIDRIQRALQPIPNYTKYFIVDHIEMCTPNPLSQEDLEDFDDSCSTIENINRTNINQHLDELRLLNIPNGGTSLDKVFKLALSVKDLERINHLLIKLFVNGILPMNKNNIYHCDIKAANIVYDPLKQELKLIDWGWASIEPPISKINEIPKKFRNLSSFFFNYPLGLALLSTDFEKQFTSFLHKHYFHYRPKQLLHFVIDYIYNCLHNANHMSYIDKIVAMLNPNKKRHCELNDKYKKNKHYKFHMTINIIAHYLVKLIQQFALLDQRTQQISMIMYFKKKYLVDIDKCGFISIYVQLLLQNAVSKQMKKIMWKYIFQPSYEPINSHDMLDHVYLLTNTSQRKNNNNITKRIISAYNKKK
jgi:serine/threonine protein kinase